MQKGEKMEIHLYKQKNSKFWWMRYTENGQLVRKSTKCAKKSEAKDVADLEREQWKRRIGIGVREPITLKDLIQEVEKDYSLNGKKSADRIEFSKKHLVKIFGENTPIEKITEQSIEDYKHTRKQEDCANGTINRELALLRRGFNLLRIQNRISQSPRISLLAENNVRQGFIEVWQYKEILKHLPEHLRPLITFLYKTGWRKSEALNLTWDMVDFNRRQVRLPIGYTKNKKPRIFPFDDELERIFKRLWNEKEQQKIGIAHVFLNQNKTGPIVDFRGSWDSACDEAKIGKRLIHDMRRSAVRNMVESGVSEKVAMELSGHLTRTVFENYHIVSTDDLVKAVQKVSATLKKAEKPKEKAQDGIMPNVPFRSAKHGGDFIMHVPEDDIFPAETIHFQKPTEKEWKAYIEALVEKFGVDELKTLVKQYEGQKKWKKYVKLAVEKIESLEQEKS
jgi:integrase